MQNELVKTYKHQRLSIGNSLYAVQSVVDLQNQCQILDTRKFTLIKKVSFKLKFYPKEIKFYRLNQDPRKKKFTEK